MKRYLDSNWILFFTTLEGKHYEIPAQVPGNVIGDLFRANIIPNVVEEVLRLAERNPDWEYKRIAGIMKYLGYDISASTVRNILDEHGIVPDPERRLRGDWDQFIEMQQYVTAATDFAQVEMLTPGGLVRESLLFFMDIGTREVRLGGIVHDPDGNWTTQIARNMCDIWDGFMLGKRYLIHEVYCRLDQDA